MIFASFGGNYENIWIIATLLCHIVFYFALNKRYVKLLDFLPKSRINIRDVKLFWNDIFIQRLMNMNDLIVKQTLIYNTIFINDEQLQNIRLYNIECKIKELKSLRYEKN